MRLGLLILLALLGVTWFEFQVYPGHSFLNGETQLLVPMLERLDSPGFLSRDVVASHPVFAYTIYDEITQLLHAAGHLSFEQALLRQQMLFRFAAVLGLFLFARGLKVTPWPAVLLSGVVNAITFLAAPSAYVTNPEPTPAAFALALVLLAAGLLVNRHSLLAGLAAGVALLYDPVTAAPFWFVVIVLSISQRAFRRLLRPTWITLLIFGLILANLSQLQAGIGGGQELTSRLSDYIVQLTQARIPAVWVSLWARTGIWSYLFVAAAGVWALARISSRIDGLTRWVAAALPITGLLSVAAAVLLLNARLQFATAMPLAANLSFTIAISVLVCGAACWHAIQHGKLWERLCWAALPVAALLNPQILDLFHLKQSASMLRQAVTPEVSEMAAWAEQNTWGSSMFQFVDAGKSLPPGAFRALSRRSLWADWQSGLIAASSGQAGQEWWLRWQANSPEDYSVQRLQAMLPLPIDYYVLQRRNRLARIKPVFSNAAYVVYDAQDLRHQLQQ